MVIIFWDCHYYNYFNVYFCCNSSAAFVVTETDSIHSTCTKNYDLPAKTTQQTIYYQATTKHTKFLNRLPTEKHLDQSDNHSF